MMSQQIPIPYKVILKRFWECSEFGKLKTSQARIILVQIFRMGDLNKNKILNEMKEKGYIELNNHKYLLILIPSQDLVSD